MTTRQVGGGLLLISLVLLLVAAFTDTWWTMPGDKKTGGCGLLGITESVGLYSDGAQMHTSYSEIIQNDESREHKRSEELSNLMWMGRVTFVLTLLLSLVIGAVLLRVATNRPVLFANAQFAAAATAIAAIAFVTCADEFRKAFSFGSGFYLFWTGVLVAIVAERMLVHASIAVIQVSQPQAQGLAHVPAGLETSEPVTAPPPAARMSRACPQCRAPTQWIEEHERYFCSRCDAYI